MNPYFIDFFSYDGVKRLQQLSKVKSWHCSASRNRIMCFFVIRNLDKGVMNTKKILLGAFVVLIGLGLSSFTDKDDDRNFQVAKNLDIFNAIFKELDLFYVDTINPEKMIQNGVNGMLALTDPYTEYYPEEEMSSLKEMITGKYGGIGAVIRYYEKKDRIAIIEPVEGMPAAEAGVKAGDIILSVGGKEMVRGDMKPQDFSSKVSDALRGEPGTSFILKVLRPMKNDSTVMEFKLTRKNIRNNPVPYYGIVQDSVGYLALSSFTDNCAKDVKKAFIELKDKGAKALIFDLRDNGGGSLQEAVDIINLFVPKGKEIVVTKGKLRQAAGSFKTTNEPIDTEIPLAVLVNGITASASEILSGSLQDLDRAVIIGTRTYGKGLVQTTEGDHFKILYSQRALHSGDRLCQEECRRFSCPYSRQPDECVLYSGWA